MINRGYKIACFGNSNNFMFSLVRYLRDQGYDAWLFLQDETQHFLPQYDSFSDEFKNYTFHTTWHEKGFKFANRVDICNILRGFNFVIASGMTLAYLAKADIKADIFIPYGSDLYDFKDERSNDVKENIRYTNQRKGILNAKNIIFDYTNTQFEQLISSFNFGSKLIRKAPPFIYVKDFNLESAKSFFPLCSSYSAIKEIRDKSDLLIFHHSRHCWKKIPDEWSYKGNEKAIAGFGSFLKKFPDYKAKLVLLEYGNDVDESKKLIEQLGIQDNVFWLPILPRKELLVLISLCDLGIGEIGRHSWFSYGTIYEFLCMKKPVIHFRDDSLYTKTHPISYPMYSCKDAAQVSETLEKFREDKRQFVKTGEAAYDWYIEHAINAPLKIIIELINKNKSKPVNIFKVARAFIGDLKFKIGFKIGLGKQSMAR